MMMITGPEAKRKMLNNRKTLEVQGVQNGCEIVVCYTDTITPATDDMDTGDSTELFEDVILLKEEVCSLPRPHGFFHIRGKHRLLLLSTHGGHHILP